mmetsp:Transcript_1268/g.2961  ORF Transcript_1268/g.2961 Transcript_1268/m.2961 type:complete len:260 (-) Transcript_1268:21-800(-)
MMGLPCPHLTIKLLFQTVSFQVSLVDLVLVLLGRVAEELVNNSEALRYRSMVCAKVFVVGIPCLLLLRDPLVNLLQSLRSSQAIPVLLGDGLPQGCLELRNALHHTCMAPIPGLHLALKFQVGLPDILKSFGVALPSLVKKNFQVVHLFSDQCTLGFARVLLLVQLLAQGSLDRLAYLLLLRNPDLDLLQAGLRRFPPMLMPPLHLGGITESLLELAHARVHSQNVGIMSMQLITANWAWRGLDHSPVSQTSLTRRLTN